MHHLQEPSKLCHKCIFQEESDHEAHDFHTWGQIWGFSNIRSGLRHLPGSGPHLKTAAHLQEFQTKGGRLVFPVGCYHLEDWLLDAVHVPKLIQLLQTGKPQRP